MCQLKSAQYYSKDENELLRKGHGATNWCKSMVQKNGANGAMNGANGAMNAENGAINAANGAMYAANGAIYAANGSLNAENDAMNAENGAINGANGAMNAENSATNAANGAVYQIVNSLAIGRLLKSRVKPHHFDQAIHHQSISQSFSFIFYLWNLSFIISITC